MSRFVQEMQQLIKKEQLDDPAIYFADYKTFEEIPLFSRFKDISFLSSLSFNEKNKILIETGLEIIAGVYSCLHEYIDEEKRNEYFLCLSLTDWDDYEEINCLTPNLFISRRKSWLLSHLELKETQTIEENLVREYLSSLDVVDYKVCIPSDFSENKRVYIVCNI